MPPRATLTLMPAEPVAVARRLDNVGVGLLAGLLAAGVQVTVFLLAYDVDPGNAPAAIGGTFVCAGLLALASRTFGARWAAGSIVVASGIWAY